MVCEISFYFIKKVYSFKKYLVGKKVILFLKKWSMICFNELDKVLWFMLDSISLLDEIS